MILARSGEDYKSYRQGGRTYAPEFPEVYIKFVNSTAFEVYIEER